MPVVRLASVRQGAIHMGRKLSGSCQIIHLQSIFFPCAPDITQKHKTVEKIPFVPFSILFFIFLLSFLSEHRSVLVPSMFTLNYCSIFIKTCLGQTYIFTQTKRLKQTSKKNKKRQKINKKAKKKKKQVTNKAVDSDDHFWKPLMHFSL